MAHCSKWDGPLALIGVVDGTQSSKWDGPLALIGVVDGTLLQVGWAPSTNWSGRWHTAPSGMGP